MLQMMNFPANESMLTAVRCEKEFILHIHNTQCFELTSGVGTGGSGGSMNRGPRAPGAPE